MISDKLRQSLKIEVEHYLYCPNSPNCERCQKLQKDLRALKVKK